MTSVPIDPKALALIRRIARREGVTPAELIRRTFKAVPGKLVQRFREIETAADLEPGGVLQSLLEISEGWVADKGSLTHWVLEGWDIDPAAKPAIHSRLEALAAKWREER